jgi:hypothetical protein
VIIATYQTKHPEVAENRRWLAQIEKIKGNYYVCFHGTTEEEVRDKAQYFFDSGGKVRPKDTDETPTPKRREVEDLA